MSKYLSIIPPALALAIAVTPLAAPAHAADLGRPAPERYRADPYLGRPPLSIERWTGFYVGAALGGTIGTTEMQNPFTGAVDIEKSGAVGTIFAGYDYQFGQAVVGLEADIGMGTADGSAVVNGLSQSVALDALGSVRGRLGVLASPSLLVYATGGFAWANIDVTAPVGLAASDTFTGYQLGGGIEWRFAPQWSLRAEYLYTDLDKQTFSGPGGVTTTVDPDFHTVRAGLSFKF